MRWTVGLLLLAAAGCGGYRSTRMIACPETGCGNQYAARVSPQGLPSPVERQRPAPRPIYRAEPVSAPAPMPPPAEMPPDESPPPPAPY